MSHIGCLKPAEMLVTLNLRYYEFARAVDTGDSQDHEPQHSIVSDARSWISMRGCRLKNSNTSGMRLDADIRRSIASIPICVASSEAAYAVG